MCPIPAERRSPPRGGGAAGGGGGNIFNSETKCPMVPCACSRFSLYVIDLFIRPSFISFHFMSINVSNVLSCY